MKEKNEPIGFVLVSDMSRISRSRDMLELYNIAQTIKYLGAEICSIDNYLLDNSEIKLAKDIIMLIKDYENEDRRNRVKAGIQNKKLRLAQAF
jgi:DNA invertase Pin-like site-specific DNA recombinase